jgi:hypothetical protein
MLPHLLTKNPLKNIVLACHLAFRKEPLTGFLLLLGGVGTVIGGSASQPDLILLGFTILAGALTLRWLQLRVKVKLKVKVR